ncbi:MAG: fatty acyl-AMP ligase [Deltaproteobacteria bacterium]|nr:fatty acyl-AMP ligase [Deltaproteobacteria bacterium]
MQDELDLGSSTTLVALLRHRAATRPEQVVYTFLDRGEIESARLTYGKFDERARAIGAHLRSVAKPAARALLLFPPGLDFVEAFFGCLYGGLIAVPAYPPDPSRLNRSLPRLLSMANDAETTVVLTTSQILPMAQGLFPLAPELSKMTWIATDAVKDDEAANWVDPEATWDTLTFLQYTSGSTAEPKGVMVTHGNLLHNQQMICTAFDQDPSDVVVSWLPLYHDMGLIGQVMQPIYVGGSAYLMSPLTFLKRPLRWLQAITKYRATTATGPNFAYDLCVRKITDEQRDSLDLSSWQHALNGAEPVRAQTIERFVEFFAPCGFRREAFYPCYGLAENTLVVTGKKASAQPAQLDVDAKALERHEIRVPQMGADRNRLVGSGVSPVKEQQVLIVDPESFTPLTDGNVGEIWIHGPSVAQGYWRRPQETKETFEAEVSGGTQAGKQFLRTGDLGFMQRGELFVTGRLKDVIIVRGQNYYPQDVEWAAEGAHPALRPGSSAAFAIEHDGKELVALVAEVDKKFSNGARDELAPREIADAVRAAVMKKTGLYLHALALIKAGSIGKTSSGKIQRRPTRELFRKGELELLGAHITVAENGPAIDELADLGGTMGDLSAYLPERPAERSARA